MDFRVTSVKRFLYSVFEERYLKSSKLWTETAYLQMTVSSSWLNCNFKKAKHRNILNEKVVWAKQRQDLRKKGIPTDHLQLVKLLLWQRNWQLLPRLRKFRRLRKKWSTTWAEKNGIWDYSLHLTISETGHLCIVILLFVAHKMGITGTTRASQVLLNLEFSSVQQKDISNSGYDLSNR